MRPTYLEVNLTQLKQNLENIRAKAAPAKVLVVLKANAYGHGVDGVAPFIAPFADFIGVAIVEEGIHHLVQPILYTAKSETSYYPSGGFRQN